MQCINYVRTGRGILALLKFLWVGRSGEPGPAPPGADSAVPPPWRPHNSGVRVQLRVERRHEKGVLLSSTAFRSEEARTPLDEGRQCQEHPGPWHSSAWAEEWGSVGRLLGLECGAIVRLDQEREDAPPPRIGTRARRSTPRLQWEPRSRDPLDEVTHPRAGSAPWRSRPLDGR